MTTTYRAITALFTFLALPAATLADVSEKLPAKIDPADRWVFYAHGSAVYKKNKKSGWEKKNRAFSGDGYRVITEERFDIDEEAEYAEKVVSQVNTLLAKGVPAKQIFVGGFSRGATISLDVANRIKNPGLNYILIAGCKEDATVDDDIKGRFLSLYASDDEKDYTSCKSLLDGKPGVSFTEKMYAEEGHGYFSGMDSSWYSLIRDWMKQTN